MLISTLLYVIAAFLALLIKILPSWNPIPSDFGSWIAMVWGWVWGLDWFIPVDALRQTLIVSLTVDTIMVVYWVAHWIIGWLPFIHKHK